MSRAKVREVGVKVRCIGCSATKVIKAGEVAPGDHPMCDRCGMPFVPVEARGQVRR